MTIALKVWTSPKTQEVRVYASAFHERGEMAYADGAYFVSDENGMTKIGGFKPCYSGNYGRAAYAIFDAFRMDGMAFSDLISMIDICRTKGGNFSESQYFKAMKSAA